MPYTVLRTAAGSPVAPSIIRQLKSLPGIRVVAADIDPLSCGFQVADAHRVVPRVNAPGFIEAMLKVCREESVDLLFPDLDEELPLVATARSRFEAIGTKVLISAPEAISICFDKYSTYHFFREHDIPTPRTFLPEQVGLTDVAWPLLIKPRSGRGSQGVYKLNTAEELAFFCDYVTNPIIQTFAEGVEYTIDTLSDLDGRFLYCSIRQRLATDSGISVKGRTVRHPVIEEFVQQIVEGIGLIGPACVQCIEQADGRIKFIEVNPRIAGSAALSMAAGAPLVTDAVRLMRDEEPEGLRDYKTGRVMLRHWHELFVDED